jgi:hypothetical protein
LQEGFYGGRTGQESRQHLAAPQTEEDTRELLHPVAAFTATLQHFYGTFMTAGDTPAMLYTGTRSPAHRISVANASAYAASSQ